VVSSPVETVVDRSGALWILNQGTGPVVQVLGVAAKQSGTAKLEGSNRTNDRSIFESMAGRRDTNSALARPRSQRDFDAESWKCTGVG
jgi:hypothetical protein